MTSYPPRFQGDQDHDRFRLRSVRHEEPTLQSSTNEGKHHRQQNYEEHPVRRIHLQQDEDIRNLSFFKRLGVAEGNLEEEVEWQDRQSPINFILIAGILFIFASVGWFGYRWYTTNTHGHPPIIQSEVGPFKVRPENPGGTIFPHEDKLIYNRLAPGQYQPVERLLPPPEQPQPIHQPNQDQGYYQPSYPQQGQAPIYPQQGYPEQQPQQPYQVAPQQQVPYPAQQGQVGNYQQQGYTDPYQGQPQQQYYQGQGQGQPQPYPHPSNGQRSEPPYAPQPMPPSPQHPYQQVGPDPYPNPPPPNQQHHLPPMTNPNPMPQRQDQQRLGQLRGEESYDKSGLNDLLSDGDEAPKAEVHRKREERETTGKSQKVENSTQTNQINSLNKGLYAVQVATFSDKSTARSEINRLIKMEPKLFKNRKFAIQYLELGPHKKPVYRIVVGSFNTSNQAAQFRGRLKVHNVKGIVIKLAEPQQ